uniref:HAT C-terminal dimerisation domain-containing protein n=2 Tax=Stomoxys calcitrans TaxID=35570 RepID=A0A1I8PQE9_STOCA
MQLHRKKCHLDPDDEDSEARIGESDVSIIIFINIVSFKASSPTTSNTQTKIKHFFRKVTKTDKERLDIRAARFFFACNVPFVAASNKYFKEFCNAMQPTYKPPSRKRLAGPLLDAVHKEQIDLNGNFLKEGAHSVLLIDGWKNSASNTKNVAALLHNCDHRIFLESYDFSNLRETSENLAEMVKNAVALAKDRYKVEVFAVVTDNAANMMSMGRIIDLIHTTCNAHIGNLLSKDLIRKYGSGTELNKVSVISQRRHTRLQSQQIDDCFVMQEDNPDNSSVLAKVHKIVNEFKKANLEKKLTMLGGAKPKLPCATRWCSERDGLFWLINNIARMKQISAETNTDGKPYVKPSVSELLFKEDFIQSVKELLDLLNPVAILIKNCQKSVNSIADATEEWINLLASANPKLYEVATERCKTSDVFNKYSLTANMLHPLYKGSQLNAEQNEMVEDFLLENLDEDGLQSLLEYKKSTGFFALLMEKTTKPDLFWDMAANRRKSLAIFAQKLLMIPASTAQLEGIFSNWSHVHTDLRNRLDAERSKKLLEVYFSLKINENKDDYYRADDVTDCSEKEN